jgi:4-hydroxy-2-oxoglutarate aldolase
MLKLQGVYAPLTTPFDHQGEIYRAKVRHNVDKWNRVKLAGYLAGGEAGEGPLLTAAEKESLWGQVAEAAAPGRLLMADVTSESVRETVRLARVAAGLGYGAVFVAAPKAYPRQYEDAPAHQLYFAAVADQSPVPVIADSLHGEALSHPNIGAVVGRTVTTSTFSMAGALEAGATATLCDFAAAAPYACITIWEAHRTREFEAARDWQQRINPGATLIERYGPPAVKYAMECNGYYGGVSRLPLRPLDSAAKRQIEAAFTDLRG